MGRNQGFENSLRCLQHPLTLLSIGVLLLNDHVFKAISPSWLTGKLSDFAGLFFFPFIVAAALSILLFRFNLRLRTIGRLAFGLVVIWFFLFKTTLFVNYVSITFISKLLRYPIQLFLDASDLLALIILWPSWKIWNQIFEAKSLRAGHISLLVGVLACIATSPRAPGVEVVTHLIAQNNRVFALDYNNKTAALSKDGGKSWNWAEVNDFDTALWPTEAASLPVMICVPEKQNECYRINNERIVEISRDRGNSWEISWELPADRISYIKRANPDINLGPYDLLIFRWENQDYVLVAAGEEGILRRELPDGEWERIQVVYANPTSYKAVRISDAISLVRMELLIWFLVSILAFIAACWIVWSSNSKALKQPLSKGDWIFSPALSPLLGIFLTLFIEIVVGVIFLALIQITGFISDVQNGLLVFFALCMVMVLVLLPTTIYRRLNRWKLTLIQHDCPPMIAQRLVVTSYLSHVFVFAVGALVWLSWTFDIISRYSLALVSALICTGLIAIFFLKRIQDLSKQHEAMAEK